MRFDYASLCENSSLSEEEKIVLLVPIIDKVEKMLFEFERNGLTDIIEKIDDNLGYVVSLIDYYEAVKIKADFYTSAVRSNIYEEAVKKARNRRAKRRRLSKFINKQFKNNSYVYFITYTFSDKELAITKSRRRRKVLKFLKSISNSFALNIDYGEQNGREHYHATISTDDRLEYRDLPSNVYAEAIPNQVEDIEAISRYILKLSLHGVKSSTNNERITYYKK